MPHQDLLTDSQRLSLQTPMTDERGMVRHYTLSSEDLTLINRRRSDPNRLGFALMLCYLRFPGRILQQGEHPPAVLCAFVAEQLSLDAAHFGEYAARDQTRRAHVREIETALGLRPLTRPLYRELAAWLAATALATDHGPTLVATVLEELRMRRIVCPPVAVLERLAGSVRARARRQLWRRLTEGLTDPQRHALDHLLEVRAGGGQSTLAWLRQTAYAATPGNFPKLIERLSLVRALGIEPERTTRIHQNYWLQLAREGGQSTVQHLGELEPLRRYATLTALVLDLMATLTDEAINMFEHLVGQLFKKSERTHAERFHASGKSINEKVRLYARVGHALIEARASGGDVFAAIEAVLPWPKFAATVAEAQTLAQPDAFDFLALLDARYSSVRRFAPLLLAHFEFQGAPAAAELLQALALLHDLNVSGKRTLPEDIPSGFVKPRWRPYVFPAGGVDRRFYELCALADLRDRLRAGDIWVTGSRQYRDFDTYLLPAATFAAMQKDPLPLDLDTHLPSYLAECRQRLEDTLTTVAAKARENTLPDVTLADGKLRLSPLRKNTPASAEAFAAKAYALLPHVRITDLLAEVDQWTSMGDRFVHLRTQAPPKNRQALLTAVLADGINLGLTRMAAACPETSWRQLCWTADWHVREECYAQALADLSEAQHRQPLAAHWGSGATSSSDAQFFRAGGRGAVAGLVNLHYGPEPGVKFYTHLSDQFGPFHTKVIAATAHEAPYVLDGLLYHQSSLVIHEHYTDTGGFSDHVFALCRLLGFRFAPRIRDLKDKRLYLLPGMTVPPEFASLVAGAINVRVLSDQWFALLRLALSIKKGTVTASVILRKLAAYPQQNSLALALRELGKLERTFFTLQWLQDPDLRRRSHVGLNKGEQHNALRRAVFFHRLGEIRDRSYENQSHRASGLNLLVAAIILWNTTYLQRAVDHLRDQGQPPTPGDLAHLSPLGWEHINLTGDYHWETSPTLGPDQFRPLRTRTPVSAAAA